MVLMVDGDCAPSSQGLALEASQPEDIKQRQEHKLDCFIKKLCNILHLLFMFIFVHKI